MTNIHQENERNTNRTKMAFPRKFKKLLERTAEDVEAFDEAWITWAVCGCEKESCGWEGWILEAVLKTRPKRRALPSDTRQICPACGLMLFRTGVSVRVVRSTDQTPHLIPGVDYDVAEMEWED